MLSFMCKIREFTSITPLRKQGKGVWFSFLNWFLDHKIPSSEMSSESQVFSEVVLGIVFKVPGPNFTSHEGLGLIVVTNDPPNLSALNNKCSFLAHATCQACTDSGLCPMASPFQNSG